MAMRRDMIEYYQGHIEAATAAWTIGGMTSLMPDVLIGSRSTVKTDQMPIIALDFVGESAFEEDEEGSFVGPNRFRVMELGIVVLYSTNDGTVEEGMDWIDAISSTMNLSTFDNVFAVTLADVEIDMEPEGIKDVAILRLSYDIVFRTPSVC